MPGFKYQVDKMGNKVIMSKKDKKKMRMMEKYDKEIGRKGKTSQM
jgi:hypothetical protein